MTQPPTETDLATAIVALYQGPLEDFINRRDGLAKELRTAKRRDDAALVKALRKPSRMAWSLDGVVREDPKSIEQLAAAITKAQSGVDLRTALELLKEAVRAVAAAGARVAVRAGQPLEPNALAMAVNAIIGDANAFAEFRAGRLAEVPQGGGLDLLSALTAIPSPPPPPPPAPAKAVAKAAPKAAPPPVMEPPKPDPRIALAAAARVELQRAESALVELRGHSERASKSLRDTEAQLDAAERALATAQAEVNARRDELERARQDAESAGTKLDDAQRAVDEARARLADLE